MIRLDKLLSNLGYCSRSESRRFVREFSVLVKGESPRTTDLKVDPAEVTVDGEALDPGAGMVILLNKPTGYTCSHSDLGPLIYELLPERFSRRTPPLSSVGRLDKETSGLLLLTDDGQLLHRLTSPKSHIKKVYSATLAEDLRGDEGEVFASGTMLLDDDPKPLKPAFLEVLSDRTALITIEEGRYHQIRRMFAAVGNAVLELERIKIGQLTLEDLPQGEFRILSESEIALALQKDHS